MHMIFVLKVLGVITERTILRLLKDYVDNVSSFILRAQAPTV